MTLPQALGTALAWGAAGVPLGWATGRAFFGSLHATVRRLIERSVGAALALQLLRLAALAAALSCVALAVPAHAAPAVLVGTLPGLLAARRRVLRAVQRGMRG